MVNNLYYHLPNYNPHHFIGYSKCIINIMIRNYVGFCNNESRFMPLSNFQLICIRISDDENEKKKFIFIVIKLEQRVIPPLNMALQ